MKEQSFLNKVLVGLSIGIVVALIPSALLGELMKAINLPIAKIILNITTIAIIMVPVAIGLCIGIQFKFTPIQNASLAIATVVGSGVVKSFDAQGLLLKGTGDVVNSAITAAIAAYIIIKLGNSLKAYTILLTPIIVIVGAGGIGLFLLPYISNITKILGLGIAHVTTLQPYIMGILIAIIFALLIVSPFSTVGIAIAISISGIASGAANLGIVAAGIGLAISGRKVNTFGTSIAHFLGSPKMQMANFIKNPIMIIPILFNAAFLGLLSAIFNVQGTTFSAGFGISGLIGPINAYNTGSNIFTVIIIFVILPIIFGYISDYIFKNIFKIVDDKDYEILYN